MCTDICVVSNALLLKAALPEADFIVNGALCAGVTPQKHEPRAGSHALLPDRGALTNKPLRAASRAKGVFCDMQPGSP